jgi:hypothetical protein
VSLPLHLINRSDMIEMNTLKTAENDATVSGMVRSGASEKTTNKKYCK